MLFRGIQCEKCGYKVEYTSNPSNQLIKKWARQNGWSCEKKDLCPKCKKQKINKN